MPEIFLIGKSVLKKEYSNVLASKGHKIKNFASLKEALPNLKENPDLLVILEGDDKEAGFTKFLKLSRNIPKVVVSDIHGIPKSLIKEPLTYPILSPGERELNFAVNRLLRERELISEYKKLKNNSSLLKQELDFCEGINRILFSCKDFTETLNTVMKRAKEITNAEGGSVFLVVEEPGELISDIEVKTKNKINPVCPCKKQREALSRYRNFQ